MLYLVVPSQGNVAGRFGLQSGWPAFLHGNHTISKTAGCLSCSY